MASIGAFIAGDAKIIDVIKYNVRSQIFAKSLPLALVIGLLKRLELIRNSTEHKDKLWTIVNAIQKGYRDNGYNIGTTQSPVTPVVMNGEVMEAVNLVKDLRLEHSIFCSVVVYPVIPKGMIILRIIPTASHSLDDVSQTLVAFEAVKRKLDDGVYQRAGVEGAYAS